MAQKQFKIRSSEDHLSELSSMASWAAAAAVAGILLVAAALLDDGDVLVGRWAPGIAFFAGLVIAFFSVSVGVDCALKFLKVLFRSTYKP
jgi:hypothetical protein